MGYTSVQILVFLDLSVLDVSPMYATDRQTDVRRASSLNASALWDRGIIIRPISMCNLNQLTELEIRNFRHE